MSSNMYLILESSLLATTLIYYKLSALTLEDDKRDISQMICAFINKIELIEKDKIEQYLNFYSEARASFSNLDNVIALLVHVL